MMKRLFALLLVCLLPMQGFAGLLVCATVIGPLSQVSGVVVLEDKPSSYEHTVDYNGMDKDSPSADCSEDCFSIYAGGGDEFTLNSSLDFSATSTNLVLVQRNDDVRQPPFLPPVAPPPRG